MNQIRTRVLIGADHRISGVAPADVPPGEHEAVITIVPAPVRSKAIRAFDVNALPVVDLGPWPEGLSLSRADLYDDDGR